MTCLYGVAISRMILNEVLSLNAQEFHASHHATSNGFAPQ